MSCVLLATTTDSDFRLIRLFTYCVTGSVSAFVINDAADALEGEVGNTSRNPLVTGELDYKSVLKLFTVVSALSVTFLIGLNMIAFYFRVNNVSACLPILDRVRFKDRPPADLSIHGLVPALLAITSYTAFNPIGIDTLLLSALIFASSCVVELLQQLHDLSVRGSVKYLGIKRSKDLVLVLSIIVVVLYVVLTILRYELRPLTIYTFSAFFILKHIVMFRNDVLSAEELIKPNF